MEAEADHLEAEADHPAFQPVQSTHIFQKTTFINNRRSNSSIMELRYSYQRIFYKQNVKQNESI